MANASVMGSSCGRPQDDPYVERQALKGQTHEAAVQPLGQQVLEALAQEGITVVQSAA